MSKTKKPSGLALTRKGNTFTAKWKISDKDYKDGQVAQYKTNSGWKDIPVGKTTTSKAFSVPSSGYWPNTGKKKMSSVKFRVRGNRSSYKDSKNKTINPTMSDWSEEKTFSVKAPNKPSLSASVGTYPSTTFTWKTKVDTKDNKWFTNCEYVSVLLKDSNIKKGKDVNWKTENHGRRYYNNNASADDSLPITEDSETLADGSSYTRWFKITARGPAGASATAYASHTYAMSNQPQITKCEVKSDPDAQGYVCKVWFDISKSTAYPVKQCEVQYAIAVPDADMECPDGASWQTGQVVKPYDKTSGAVFSVDTLLNDNQCLFVRVNATYDERTTFGSPYLADSGILSTPDNLEVTTNDGAFTATVSAENKSQVPDSFLVVRYYEDDDPDGIDIAIIPASGTATGIQCPNWTDKTKSFGVYAAVGDDITFDTRDDGVRIYTINSPMLSSVNRENGDVPLPPTSITLKQTDVPGTVRVAWDWSWENADSAELSWSDHKDAWESTDEPSTYTITKLYSSAWNISGLETGVRWYIRVRLLVGSGDNITYGAYSEIAEIDLSSAPTVPVLSLSTPVITEDGSVTANWSYSTTDGTPQAFATVAEVTEENGETVYTVIDQVETQQFLTISADEMGWASGESHALAVKVVSASGRESDGWSDSQYVYVAEPLVCEITSISLDEVTTTTTDEQGETVTDTELSLTDMPLLVSVTGGGLTTIAIERLYSYTVDRPDENNLTGYEGETISIASISVEDGETADFEIDNSDLIGRLDDGAWYRLIATVQDDLGQVAGESVDFVVHWADQAIVPEAEVEIDEEFMMAKLMPIAPQGSRPTDVCDIYRLSVDRPELIYEGAAFGETYVDPYPTIGDWGGYRFVMRTANGDYITETEQFAWVDIEDPILESGYNVIDFGTGRALIEYNVDVSNAWKKDFKETHYLGGSVQGDWNPSITRTSSVGTVAVVYDDPDLIETMRRLAVYPGICHVRTKDGSSYPADVQVSESYQYSQGQKIAGFSLSITRVDQEELDGMTLDEWNEVHDEEI